MKIIEVTSLSSETREFMDAETGRILSPEETKDYLEKLNEKKKEYTKLDELAHEWNKRCKKKVPYEFIEWLKMVY